LRVPVAGYETGIIDVKSYAYFSGLDAGAEDGGERVWVGVTAGEIGAVGREQSSGTGTVIDSPELAIPLKSRSTTIGPAVLRLRGTYRVAHRHSDPRFESNRKIKEISSKAYLEKMAKQGFFVISVTIA